MVRLLVICLVLAALLTGFVAVTSPPAQPPADFVFINRGDHKTLDPGLMAWLQDIRVAYALWEGLYTLDPKTLKPVPGVADRTEVDPTGTIYTFHLRPEARWCNGDRVTTGDFVFAWRRMLEQPADYTSLHFYIQGAKEYSEAYAAWVEEADKGHGGEGLTKTPPPDYGTVGVKAIDDATLQVTLRNPTPFFLSLCAFPPFFPQHEPSMRAFAQFDEKTGRVASYDEGFTRPPHLIGNGPYRLDQWVFKRNLRLVASDQYWNRAAVASRIIDEPVVEDSLAALRAYRSGQVDWLSWVEESLIGQMKEKGGYDDLHTFKGFGTYFYSLNCLPKLSDGRPNPLADVRVRRALALAIDKTAIVQNVTKAGEVVANDYIPPGVFGGYVSPDGLGFDPAKARQLLAEAGYPNGEGFPSLQIIFNKEVIQHADIALLMRSMWQKNLGITVDVQQLEIKVFAARYHARDFAIARGSWIGDYPDPTTFTDKFKSGNDDNEPGWSNPAYDALCAAAEKQTDANERMKTLARAEGILLQDAPIIPLYHYVDAYMMRSDVVGVPLDPRDMVMLSAVRKIR